MRRKTHTKVFCASHNLVAMTTSDRQGVIPKISSDALPDAPSTARQLGETIAVKSLLSHFSSSTAWRSQPDSCGRTTATVAVVGEELGDLAAELVRAQAVTVEIARLTQTPREPLWDRRSFSMTLTRPGHAGRLDAIWIPSFLIGVGPSQVREAFSAIVETQSPGTRVLAQLNAAFSPATAQTMLRGTGLKPILSRWVDGSDSRIVLAESAVA